MALTFIDSWLVAEGTDSGRWYIVHTQEPLLIIEIRDRDDGGYESGDVLLLDNCADAAILAALMREAGDIFAAYDRGLDKEREHF